MKAYNPQTGETLILKNGRWISEGFDTERESPFSERLAAGVRITKPGQVEYLKSIHGKDNVSLTGDTIFIRDPKTGKTYKHDKPGFTKQDFADIIPDIVQAAPEIFAGLKTSNPWIAAGSGLVGALMRQGAGEFMPGDPMISSGERATDIALNTLLPGAFQKGSNVLFSNVDKVRPHNLLANQINRGADTPYGVEGRRIAQETGIAFTPGQETGSRFALTMEGLARRHPLSADKVLEGDVIQVNQALRHLDSLMNRLSASGKSAITIGDDVVGAFRNVVDKARKFRSSQASKDFEKIDALAGNAKVFRTENIVGAIDDLVNKFDVPGGGDATASLVNRLKSMRKELVEEVTDDAGDVIEEKAKELSGSEFQRLMEIYGKASRGTGQLFKDIDAGQQRYIAGRMFGAAQDDLDLMADTSAYSKELTDALRKARQNWRVNSGKIDDISKTVVGRMLNGRFDPAPEAVVQKFLTMHPSEIQKVVSVLNDSDPTIVGEVKRAMLEQILDKAQQSGSQIVRGQQFSTSKFITQYDKQAKRLGAIFEPRELADIRTLVSGMERLSDRAATEGSPTAVLQMALDVGKSLVSMQPKAFASVTGQGIAMRHIAEGMTTVQGRRAIRTLLESKTWTKGAVAASAYLASLSGGVMEQQGQREEPQKQAR